MTQRIPQLLPCKRCGLKVQRGKGPGGLSWHDCNDVAALREAATPTETVTVDDALGRVLAVAVAKADALPSRDLVALLANVGRLWEASRTPGSGGSDGKGNSGDGRLLNFLRPDDAGRGDPAEIAEAPPRALHTAS